MTVVDHGETASPTLRAGKPSRVAAVARENRGLILSAALWILLVLNFSSLLLDADFDSRVQLAFVERLFGDAHHALGYNFGLALFEAPFYGIGKLLHGAGLHTVSGNPVVQASTALGLGLLTVVAWPLLGAVARGLSLRHAGPALLAAALGTPFFYYATFVPGKDHALDSVLFAASIYLAYRYFSREEPERWVPYALGALFGFAYTTRYFNGAEAVALVLVLVVCRRIRDAVEVAVTSAVVCLLLFRIPAALHVPVFSGGPDGDYQVRNALTVAPLNPIRMLFTDHRGYLVWSPVALLAVPGLVSLFRRRPEHRRFLMAVVAMAAAVIASYALIPFWDGDMSFGQRYYTPLFPVVALGVAGLLDVAPRLGGLCAVVAVSWSLFLCLNLVTLGGVPYLNGTPGGADDLALLPARKHISVGAYTYGVWAKSNLLHPLFAWPFGAAPAASPAPR